MSRLKFALEADATGETAARAARFQTLHGEVKTPVFMPVGTQATVKGQSVEALKTAGSRVLLANTYHLLLRPGPEVFRKLGGIHRFMNWDGPVLTDSGGFQIFSLPHSREMNEEGARFQSYVDGRLHLLSPEESIGMQKAIGSDIMMVLDQCIPSTAGHAQAEAAMHLTHRWAKRSLKARGDSPQALFGIVQGACFHDLRKKSAEVLTELPFDGFAIGGLAVGETRELRDEFTAATAGLLPKNLPRYLMGVGTPLDILDAVHRGVDLFDCILPTALAQRGVVFTSQGKLQLRRGVYKLSEESLDAACECLTCNNYSRAYLHHLIKSDELLGWHLLASHNLTFYHRLMREMRERILAGKFADYYPAKRLELLRADEANPVKPPKKSRSRESRWSRLGDYEVHTSELGFSSIRQISSGEVMHSVSEPCEEANLLYIEQSRLSERLIKTASTAPLVIWDVGLGAATNAMAVIKCFEAALSQASSAELRPLSLISFENDLDSLILASNHPSRFVHLRHAAPYAFLEKGSWQHRSGLLHWKLQKGDFMECLPAASVPDLIFYDLFSAKKEPHHWTLQTFTGIFEHCKRGSAELFTYTTSTAARSALLAAGFFVAQGVATGPKKETTRAFVKKEDAEKCPTLLGERWFQRWEQSRTKYPVGLPDDERSQFEERIRSHPQFSG